MNTKASQAYLQTKMGTTDQGQLLLMLYDGALRFLQKAREKMLAKDYAGKGILISKALDIISELSSSLNMEKGGDLAVNLGNLYFLCMARLLEANLKMNVERLDSVCEILSGLRSAYAQIIDTPEAKKAVAQIAQSRSAESMAIKRGPAAINTNAMPVGANRGVASNAYGKQAMQTSTDAQVAPAGAEQAMPMPVPNAASRAGAARRMGAYTAATPK